MGTVDKFKKLSEYNHNVRFNQIVAPFGVGAMVDFSDQTLMVASTDYWSLVSTIRDERLESLLGVNSFKLPPTADKSRGIPMVRFPEWYFCPKCNRFKSIKEWQKEYIPSKKATDNLMVIPTCMQCHLQLVPAGIITVCEDGHISDFPWVKWIHYKAKKSVCGNSQIKLRNSSSALGLEGLELECTNCGAKATMEGSFNKDVFEKIGKEFICSGYKPWEGKHEENCELYPRATQRGGLNVYFPKVVSSLVIPPYSDDINREINESTSFEVLTTNLNNDMFLKAFGKESLIGNSIAQIAKEIKRSEEVVRIILNKKLQDKKSCDNFTKESYRQEEYNALLGNIPKESMDTKDFKLEEQQVELYNITEFSRVSLVKRLREVRALIGFTRLNPPENSMFIENGTEEKNNVVSIKSEEVDWYPAQETRGEGIFIEFDNNKIENWISNNPEIEKRALLLEERYNKKQKNKGYYRRITPKFILLHTIAHLLIKELSFECGYNSASLAERIFCNTEDDSENMSGILIYTASGDSEGTLGGLVRQGRSDMLPKILKSAIKRAKWCSSDPVCIESSSQGRDGLNLSACHACTLIAETSCEEFNVLLDRVFIVGSLDKSIEGFFKDCIY